MSEALARRLLAAALGVEERSLGAAPSIESLEAWDSLGHARLVALVEHTLGRELDGEGVAGIASAADVAQILDREGGAALATRAAAAIAAQVPPATRPQ